MSFDLVFENEHFAIADKPHGYLCTPARDASDPRPCLGRDLQTRMGHQIYPVHRLDFEVSGLVMFAKTTVSHRESQRWFEHNRIGKTYEALSEPGASVATEWCEWRSKIAKGKRRAFEAAHGKESVTRARFCAAEGNLWKWELMPLTGRPHQLRFEMAKHGFPIWGDVLYGGRAQTLENWIALRGVALDFSAIPERFGLPENLRISGLKS
jgi:tRNA pseudouridine32 synthase/23S rRNA pseudouridine746 synthase